MSDGFNRVMLLGNVGADGDLRFTQGGQAVLNVRLATTESYLDKDKQRVDRTDWHSVVIWGKRGEALHKILTKGARVMIEGSLRTSSYDDKEGIKRYKTEIHANEVILCGGKRGGDGEGAGGGSFEADEQASRDAPQTGGYSRGPAQHTSQSSQSYQPRGGGNVASAGDFEVAFGRDKGRRISEVGDLSWLRGTLERDLADSSKERFHDKARGQLAAIDAELAKRTGGGARAAAGAASQGGGGGYAPRGGGGGGGLAPPAGHDSYDDDGAAGGFGNDDDIPF